MTLTRTQAALLVSALRDYAERMPRFAGQARRTPGIAGERLAAQFTAQGNMALELAAAVENCQHVNLEGVQA